MLARFATLVDIFFLFLNYLIMISNISMCDELHITDYISVAMRVYDVCVCVFVLLFYLKAMNVGCIHPDHISIDVYQ